MYSKENTFRIGIDKISLYNFQIKSGQLKKYLILEKIL